MYVGDGLPIPGQLLERSRRMQEIIAFWTHASPEQVLRVMWSAQGYKFFDLWGTVIYSGVVLLMGYIEKERSRKFWLAVVALVSLIELIVDIPCAAGTGVKCVSEQVKLVNLMAVISGVYFVYYCWRRLMSK